MIIAYDDYVRSPYMIVICVGMSDTPSCGQVKYAGRLHVRYAVVGACQIRPGGGKIDGFEEWMFLRFHGHR